jgi:hypothetical protein
MEDPSIEAQRRAIRYWNIDGLAELYVGLYWLAVPLFLYAANHLAKASLWYKVLIGGGMLTLMIGPIAGSLWLLPAVKRRVTWPRTGYVACRKPKSKPYWLPLLFVPLLVAMPFVPSRMILPLTGLLFAVISTLVGRSMELRRAYVFGYLICAFGIALGLAGVAVDTGMVLIFGTAGAMSMLSGGWTLWRYLEHA